MHGRGQGACVAGSMRGRGGGVHDKGCMCGGGGAACQERWPLQRAVRMIRRPCSSTNTNAIVATDRHKGNRRFCPIQQTIQE